MISFITFIIPILPFFKVAEGRVGTCDITLTKEEEPHLILFVSVAIISCVLIRLSVEWVKIPVPYLAWVSVVGFLWGTVAHYNNCVKEYTSVVEVGNYELMAAVLPVLIFKTAFLIDGHTFIRSWPQVLLISVLGILINATFVGFVMMVILDSYWYLPRIYMFGAVTSPIEPRDVLNMLKDMGYHAKHIVTLLEAESILSIAFAILLFNINDDIALKKEHDAGHVIFMVIWSIVLGPLLGAILGSLAVWMIRNRYNSLILVLLWSISFPYVGYFFCEKFLDCSSVLCVATIGIMVGYEKHAFPAETDAFLMQFWDLISIIFQTVLVFLMTMYSVRNLATYMTVHTATAILVTFILVHISRFLTFILLTPILSRLGYGFTFNKLIILIWCDIKGAIAVCLASQGLQNVYGRYGIALFSHATGIMMLTLFINAPTMSIILRLLDVAQLTLARITNMDNCVRYIMVRRERTIAMLKMDRFLSDANWPLVQKATKIKHPYRGKYETKSGGAEQDDYGLGFRRTTCPKCEKEVISVPTIKEIRDMTREARLRILKAKKISYIRQYESRLLSRDAIRILTTTVEIASDTDEALIKLDGLYKLFRNKGIAHKIRRKILLYFFKRTTMFLKKPRNRCRAVCYYIIIHPAYDIIISFVVFTNVVVVCCGLVYAVKKHTETHLVWSIINIIFTLIYLLECIFKILGYSWISIWADGFKTYFRSYWNTFDFAMLLLHLFHVLLEIVFTSIGRPHQNLSLIFLSLYLLRVLRLLKLLTMCKALYPKLVKYCDSKIDTNIAFAYEIGKGFVNAEQEILDKLPQMIDNEMIREDMRKRLDKDRMAITKELGLIQKEKPWIAVTVKTKQAMRSTINSMMESIADLKLSGWVDDFEYMKLHSLLQEKLKYINKISSIQPSEPKMIFSEVPWMRDDAGVIDFLYQNVIIKVFDEGDYVCKEGEVSEGIFIVVTGILKLTYIPNSEKLVYCYRTGSLPVIDYLATRDFNIEMEDYILTGNTVGVLCTLTDRPYDCNIISETPSQVFVLRRKDVKKAIKDSIDPVKGLESKMWKAVSLPLAMRIMSEIPAYQSWTQEKIKMTLERAFVPNLSNFKIFCVTDLVEELVLIQGVVTDYVTRENFYGPCPIPRTVSKIILSHSSHQQINNSAETKLLLVPLKDVSEYDLMVYEEEMSELVSTASEKCLQHAIQNKLKIQMKKRKKPITETEELRSHKGSERSSAVTIGSHLPSSDKESQGFMSFNVSSIHANEDPQAFMPRHASRYMTPIPVQKLQAACEKR